MDQTDLTFLALMVVNFGGATLATELIRRWRQRDRFRDTDGGRSV